MKPPHPYRVVGRWMFWHYRDMAKERGIPYTRVRMRKASIPEPLRDLILSPNPAAEDLPATAPRRPGWRGQLDRIASLFYPTERHP